MANDSVMEARLLEVSLTRRIAASPDAVFGAWIDPKHLSEWWGPKGFTTPLCEVDVRVGGAIRIRTQGPDGVAHPMSGRFVEIDRPHRLRFTATPVDERDTAFLEVLNDVMFAGFDGGTEIALVSRVTSTTTDAPRFLSGMSQGWSQSLDRLTALAVRL